MKHFKILLPVFLLISGISFSNFNQEKEIDSTKNKKNPSVLFELIAIRLLGRLMILLVSFLLFIKLV